MPVALPYDVRIRILRVTHGRTDGRTDEQFGINMVGLTSAFSGTVVRIISDYRRLQESVARRGVFGGTVPVPYLYYFLSFFRLSWRFLNNSNRTGNA